MRYGYSLEIEYGRPTDKDDDHWYASVEDDHNIVTGHGCSLCAAMMEIGRSLELLYEMEEKQKPDHEDYCHDMP